MDKRADLCVYGRSTVVRVPISPAPAWFGKATSEMVRSGSLPASYTPPGMGWICTLPFLSSLLPLILSILLSLIPPPPLPPPFFSLFYFLFFSPPPFPPIFPSRVQFSLLPAPRTPPASEEVGECADCRLRPPASTGWVDPSNLPLTAKRCSRATGM